MIRVISVEMLESKKLKEEVKRQKNQIETWKMACIQKTQDIQKYKEALEELTAWSYLNEQLQKMKDQPKVEVPRNRKILRHLKVEVATLKNKIQKLKNENYKSKEMTQMLKYKVKYI